MSVWRYFAHRVNGDGTETPLARDLPLGAVELQDELSGPGGLMASIQPEIARLKVDGRPVFETWSTAIYAEVDGLIRGGGLLVDMEPEGGKLKLDCLGFTGYAKGMPYTREQSWVAVDPLDIVRHLWAHMQGEPQGDLGLAVDGLKSPKRMGTADSPALARAKDAEAAALAKSKTASAAYQKAKAEETRCLVAAFRAAGLRTTTGKIIAQVTAPSGSSATTRNLWRDTNNGNMTHTYNGKAWVSRGILASSQINAYLAAKAAVAPAKARSDAAAKVASEAKRAREALREQAGKPYTLAWFQTFDIGKELDDLAEATPFDYRTEHSWVGDSIAHRLVLAYPRMGRRRNDLRFVVGENVFTIPPMSYAGDEYADEVLTLGAGEGRAMVRASAHRRGSRLRRVVVVEDKGIRSTAAALARSQSEVRYRLGEADIDTLTLLDHPNAPLGSIDVGDELLVSTAAGWIERTHLWVRVLSMTTRPNDNTVTVEVTRADKVN